MRVITCASYYGTGSSAVTDLFSEFDCVCSLGDYEYRFLQDPNGIADLEYNLVENNHRHNSSDAIKRYCKYLKQAKKMGYGGYDIFGNSLEEETKKYINSIVDLKVHTWWNKDRLDRGQLFCFIDRIYSYGKRLFSGDLKSEKRYSLLTKLEYGYYTSVTEDKFLKETKRYVDSLLMSVNKENKKYVMVDQMVPPSNVNRYIRYFNDVKVIVVDRDPRDIYLLEKVFWQWGVIPVSNVKDFVEWFKITRITSYSPNENSSCVCRIRFEDLVYKYEETKQKLFEFVGVDESEHVEKLKKFNPEKSKENTNLKGRVKGFEKDIKYIEDNLKEYLYNF